MPAKGLRPSQDCIESSSPRLPTMTRSSSALGAGHGLQTLPDLAHGPQVGADEKVDVEARLDLAQVDRAVGLEDQPPFALRRRQLGIGDLHHNPPRGQRPEVEIA